MSSSDIRILERQQIDDAKWDAAVQQAVNSLPYAYSWYMDALCPRWLALVAGDYDFIMPLPVATKWGLMYVYQPLFSQQLGVFYKTKSETILSQMLEKALGKFVFVDLNINYDNHPHAKIKGLSNKKNLIIRLDQPYSEVRKKYNENTARNIKKATKAGVVFEIADTSVYPGFIDFFVDNTAPRDEHFKEKHRAMLDVLVGQFLIYECSSLFLARTAES